MYRGYVSRAGGLSAGLGGLDLRVFGGGWICDGKQWKCGCGRCYLALWLCSVDAICGHLEADAPAADGEGLKWMYEWTFQCFCVIDLLLVQRAFFRS